MLSPLQGSNALRDYAERLKESNLRVWTNNGNILNYLTFADACNVAQVWYGGWLGLTGFVFKAPHVWNDELKCLSLIVNKVGAPPPAEILNTTYAKRALNFFDSGEAERLYNFKGERHTNVEKYVRSQGRLLREI